MDIKTSIVIPFYNNPDIFFNLVQGLMKHESKNIDEIVFVDDASIDDVEFAQIGDSINVRLVTNYRNLGFTHSSNKGLQSTYRGIGEQRSVFLISTDVTINGKFIQQANDILFGARRHLIGNKLLSRDTGWNTFDGVTYSYLEGWFLGATSDGWRDIGYFDENYAPHDFEDVDLSQTAKTKGYKLTPLNNPYITHKGGGSIGYSPEREAITNRNREYFRRKWVK